MKQISSISDRLRWLGVIIRCAGLVLALVLWSQCAAFAKGTAELLLRSPSVSQTQVVFVYAGCLWIVPRDGGGARPLTTGGHESNPVFSPDGSMIAFTGEYDGNQDVYVVSSAGGVPTRLTYNPASDTAVGWTPDGRQILFSSDRAAFASGVVQLFTVSIHGGFPATVPLVRAAEGSFSPDGSRIAYEPIQQWQAAWKRYRGGQTKRIWIARLDDSSTEATVPRENSNDFNPMWVGDMIYFLSDRNGPVTLFSYNNKSKQVTEVIKNSGLDFKNASAGAGLIAYEQFGAIHLFDPGSGHDRKLDVTVAADLAEVRPHFRKIESWQIRDAAISPTGARAVFGVRGEIVTVPAEKGDIRNLTNSTDAVEKNPAWSPDGKWIAYLSDESGEYAIHIRDQNGTGEVQKINLGSPPTFYYDLVWSPDSKKIAYTDKRLNVWYVDLEKKTPVHVDTDTYAGPFQQLRPRWSPDSRWIAYNRQLVSHLHAIFAYSLEQSKSYQLTDGMSDALNATFDKEGKYIYFTASTNTALTPGWLDMSSLQHSVTRNVYCLVLKKDVASPVAPESDEEKIDNPDKEKEKDKDKKPPQTEIDLDNISQRIVALPIPSRNYLDLQIGKQGVLYVIELPEQSSDEDRPSLTAYKFDFKSRKLDKAFEGLSSFDVSFNGEKLLYNRGGQWWISSADAPPGPPAPGQGPLKLDQLQIWVDPRAEWKHMYYQVWRDERDFLYDPGLHGLDLAAIQKKYEPYLDQLGSRNDLNYLFEEMLGEITVGHMFVGGGDLPPSKHVTGGLLGADYTVENGHYRFAWIYNGENWNPRLRAPLTQPGVNVAVGDYLLAVNGRKVETSVDVSAYFEETAGKQVLIRVGPNADGTGSREVTVVPVDSEEGLRNYGWIEGNRRKVDEMTGGKVAYVYMPNTGGGGYTNFNRYYFAQVGKQGVIIDERYNGGGDIADYVIDYLRRPLMSYWSMREGKDITTPIEAIFGPKVMIINEMAGSGGDAMPWLFHRAAIGTLVGKRTWGGLVGHYTNPADLLDGGFAGTPNLAFYNPEGNWEIENHGVNPDIDVEYDPKLVRQGHDPQLEKAAEVVMEQLKENPLPPEPHHPPYPDYQHGGHPRQ